MPCSMATCGKRGDFQQEEVQYFQLAAKQTCDYMHAAVTRPTALASSKSLLELQED